MYEYSFFSFLFLLIPLWDLCTSHWFYEACSLNLACHFFSVLRDASHHGGPSHSGKGWPRWGDASLWFGWYVCVCVYAPIHPTHITLTQTCYVVVIMQTVWECTKAMSHSLSQRHVHDNSLYDCDNGHCWLLRWSYICSTYQFLNLTFLKALTSFHWYSFTAPLCSTFSLCI